jgi:hypothetical protein
MLHYVREGLDETESRFLERLGNDDTNGGGVQWGCWCEQPELPSPPTLCHSAVTILFVQKGGAIIFVDSTNQTLIWSR